jgi:oligopeptide/dipeptide ABC transporter ATP-binding protein
MYLGKIVESGSADNLFSNPAHPYTQALLSASPIPDVDLERKRKRIVLRGDISNSAGTHTGCQFANRCHVGVDKDRCTSESPELKALSLQHQVSCHYPVA